MRLKRKNFDLTFARVVATFTPTGADEDVWDVLDVAGISVHGLANCVVYHRHFDLLELAGQWSILKKE
jgi:hypothetical protein